MIKFHDITTSDKELIQSFTLFGERQNCDLSFANIISWQFLYNTQYAVVDDYLIFRFYAGRHLAYMMPVAKPKPQPDGTLKVIPCDECSVEIVRAIRDDSIAMGHPLLVLGVCNYMREIIEKAFPDVFDIKPDRDYSDYIYTREKLANLTGKKLQSKRNHINKFKNLYPNYQYKPLTTDMIPECIRLEQQWRDRQTTEGEDSSMMEELRSMTRAFNRWDELGLIGGTLWVDDSLIAFTFGGSITQNTFDVCVEKADTSYEGSFSIINQEFVRHLPEQYTYINREEDMGDEGLRYAKLSYKPDILLEKFVIMEKHPLAQFEDQDRIKSETRELWQLVFNDPQPFVELYFSKVFKSEYNVCSQIGNHVVAALQTLPYTLLYHGSEVNSVYMSGVSVHPECRKQDVGNNLMRQAHFRIFQRGIIFASLIPAEEWLYDWYARLGYAKCITCEPTPADILNTSFKEYDRQQRSKVCTLLHTPDSLDVVKEDIRLAGVNYSPTDKPIQAMIRVINVKAALTLYAAQHPQQTITIKVQDDRDIPMNNAYYHIADGKVIKTEEPDATATRMSIADLSVFMFKDEHAEMTMMLN